MGQVLAATSVLGRAGIYVQRCTFFRPIVPFAETRACPFTESYFHAAIACFLFFRPRPAEKLLAGVAGQGGKARDTVCRENRASLSFTLAFARLRSYR